MKNKEERTMLVTVQDYWDNSYLIADRNEYSHLFVYKGENIYRLTRIPMNGVFQIEKFVKDENGRSIGTGVDIDKDELVEIVVRDIEEEFEELKRDKVALDLLISKYSEGKMNNFESLEMLKNIINERIELFKRTLELNEKPNSEEYKHFLNGKIEAYEMVLTDIHHLMNKASESLFEKD